MTLENTGGFLSTISGGDGGITGAAIAAVAVFALAYIAIVTEKIHRTIAAVLGAAVVMGLGVISQRTAFQEHVDLNVIFLLAGMMVVVHIMSRTGVFEWLAITLAKVARGRPINILIFLALSTGVVSAFLDNVTTVILMVPITLLLAEQLRITPVPFLICEVLASNIGGAATLIGDPPNILIGSAAGLSFNDFLVNLGPVIVVILGAFVFSLWLVFRKSFRVSIEVRARIIEMSPARAITDKKLLVKCLIGLGLIITGFFLHSLLNIEPATIALGGAAFLMLITKSAPEKVLREVEWSTLFFFVGLFVLVGGLVETNVIDEIAKGALSLTGGDIWLTALGLLWFAAFASAIVDNIPFVATAIPIIHKIGPDIAESSGCDPNILWWALALGACLGGNGTIIGASANVVVAGMAERSGHKITFLNFMKYGVPFTLMTLVISTVYVILRYLIRW